MVCEDWYISALTSAGSTSSPASMVVVVLLALALVADDVDDVVVVVVVVVVSDWEADDSDDDLGERGCSEEDEGVFSVPSMGLRSLVVSVSERLGSSSSEVSIPKLVESVRVFC